MLRKPLQTVMTSSPTPLRLSAAGGLSRVEAGLQILTEAQKR
jgi:hypothetical protein